VDVNLSRMPISASFGCAYISISSPGVYAPLFGGHVPEENGVNVARLEPFADVATIDYRDMLY
jgi:hypothetical protein